VRYGFPLLPEQVEVFVAVLAALSLFLFDLKVEESQLALLRCEWIGLIVVSGEVQSLISVQGLVFKRRVLVDALAHEQPPWHEEAAASEDE